MMTGKTNHITLVELESWLAGAQPGDRLIYCTGYLASDRGESRTPNDKKNHVLSAVAHRALTAAESGLALLFQRRHDDHVYEYLIVRRGARS